MSQQFNSHVRHPLEYMQGDHPVPGYTLVRPLGQGAMGTVWLAQTDNGFEHALKVVDLLAAGGRKEYRGLITFRKRKLRHTNLLPLHNYWLKTADGNLILDTPGTNVIGPAKTPTTPVSPMAATVSQDLDKTPGGKLSKPPDFGTLVNSPEADRGAETLPVRQGDSRGTDTGRAKQPPAGQSGTDHGQRGTDHGQRGTDHGQAGSGKADESKAVQLIVAMELGDKTLTKRLEECKYEGEEGVPAVELLKYMQHAALGLDYLHQQKIFHRDIKPQNIMLVDDVAKICDYGLVVPVDTDLAKTTNAYTPYYASPEAMDPHQGKLSGHTDQYSLAVSYVELRTGRLPYTSTTAPAVYMAKMTGEYDLSQIEKTAVRQVLERALSKDPKKRFATCVEFVGELHKAEIKPPPIKVTIPWKKLATAAAAILLLGLVSSPAIPPVRERLWGAINLLISQNPEKARLAQEKLAQEKLAQEKLAQEKLAQEKLAQEKLAQEKLAQEKDEQAKLSQEKKGKGKRDPIPPVLSAAERAFEQLQKLLAQYAPGKPPPDDRIEKELFRLLDESLPAADRLPGVKAAKSQLAELTFAKYMANESYLTDELRPEILRRAGVLGGDPLLPLVTLVAAEAELAEPPANDRASKLQKRRLELQTVIDQLQSQSDSKSEDPANKSRLEFARFLVARIALDIPFDPHSADVSEAGKVLLGWVRDTPAWRTSGRTDQSCELLVKLGESLLPPAGTSILEFHTLAVEEVARSYLSKAQDLGDSSQRAFGLLAIASACDPKFAAERDNWKEIGEWAASALGKRAGSQSLPVDSRDVLVTYVHFLSAAKIRDPSANDHNRAAVNWFAERITDPGTFRDDMSADETRDLGVLLNIIDPALKIPVSAAPPQDLRPLLARIWAAKGRTIERNRSSFVGHPQINFVAHGNQDTSAALTAHEAFENALKLDAREEYASGFGRTLQKLPLEDFNAVTHYKSLSDLIDRFDTKGTSKDPGIQLVGAWVYRRRALGETAGDKQFQLFYESLRRSKLLLEITERSDHYDLRSIGQVSASDTHLKAAFRKSFRATSGVPLAAAPAFNPNKPPDGMDKFEHLMCAVEFAKRAQQDTKRLQPEQACIAEGNAHEDLAFYCKQISHYSEADSAFERALRHFLEGGIRSDAYAWTCRGRCLYRWAGDSIALQVQPARGRNELLQAAFQALTLAVKNAAAGEPEVASESRIWLSMVLSDSAKSGPGRLDGQVPNALAARTLAELRQVALATGTAGKQEALNEMQARLELWAAACNYLRAAADSAENWGENWPTVQLASVKMREEFASELEGLPANLVNGKFDSKVELKQVVAGATDLLAGPRRKHDIVGPTRTRDALYILASANARLTPVPRSGDLKTLRMDRKTLQEGEKYLKHPGDDWLVALADVILKQARLYIRIDEKGITSDDKDITGDDRKAAEVQVERAREVAARVGNVNLKKRLEGDCDWAAADAIYRSYSSQFEAVAPLGKNVIDESKHAQDLYAKAEYLLAEAEDVRLASNLKRIREQSLPNLKTRAYEAALKLNQQEIEQLKRFITRTVPMRNNATLVLNKLLAQSGEMQNFLVPFKPEVKPLAEHYRDLVKPLALVMNIDPLQQRINLIDAKLKLP